MNIKYTKCNFENCTQPHRRNGYCTKHSYHFKRGSLGKIKQIKLCSYPNCSSKNYCHNYCIMHYQRINKNLPMGMPFRTRDAFQTNNLTFEHKNSRSWSVSVKKYYGNSCMICNWNESSCDVHHIIPKSKNGLNTLENSIVLCPNHHRLAHSNKLDLQKIKNQILEEPKGDIV
jgi:hypothetical protein